MRAVQQQPCNGIEDSLHCIKCCFLSCTNEDCAYIYHSPPPAATMLHTEDNFERMTDFAVNVLYVLTFLSIGDGCTEAARLLGLLGLPNDTTMESRSFSIIEERIAPSMLQLMDEILLDNITEEVRLSKSLSNNDFMLWKMFIEDKESIVLDEESYPCITGSFDMAWQQKGSGHRYNSASGHGFLMGSLTRKPLLISVKSKLCNFCYFYKKKNPDKEEVPAHACQKNHEGSF